MSNNKYLICFEVHRSNRPVSDSVHTQEMLVNSFGNVASLTFGLQVKTDFEAGTVQVEYGSGHAGPMRGLINESYRDAASKLEAGRIGGFRMTAGVRTASGEVESRSVGYSNLDSI